MPSTNLPRNRSKVIPDSVHSWRGAHWPMIQKLEAREGDGLRIVRSIGKVIAAHNKMQGSGTLTPKRIHNQARAIELLISELADEALRAQGISIESPEWNKAYVSALRHFWKKIPGVLRQEIIRQVKEE